MARDALPVIMAEITFLRTDEGGRRTMPTLDIPARYMPHIVIQDRDVRQAIIGRDGVLREDYQGVAFLNGPPNFSLGDTGKFQLLLMNYPKALYADVQPGATFTIREGGENRGAWFST